MSRTIAMPDIDRAICAVCGHSSQNGSFERKNDPASAIPVCPDCFQSDRLERWWLAAEKEINEFAARAALERSAYSMNIYRDLLMVRAYNKHDANIKDGVCPNGCARLEQVAGQDFTCPVCHFVLHNRNLSV